MNFIEHSSWRVTRSAALFTVFLLWLSTASAYATQTRFTVYNNTNATITVWCNAVAGGARPLTRLRVKEVPPITKRTFIVWYGAADCWFEARRSTGKPIHKKTLFFYANRPLAYELFASTFNKSLIADRPSLTTYTCLPWGGHLIPTGDRLARIYWWLNRAILTRDRAMFRTWIAAKEPHLGRAQDAAYKFTFDGRRTFKRILKRVRTREFCSWLRRYCKADSRLKNNYRFCYDGRF